MKNLSNIEHELDIVTKQYVDNAADTKVDKIEGKQLSTNDFTTKEKEKLNSLENYTLPAASADALGGVKIGNNLTIDENGVLNIDNINYTKVENKPTLNGIAIEGDKVGTDYGINDTNVYYGAEEPTTENVVMWVDPSGAPISVLTTDNTIEYTPVGDYNPATKKYVDEKVSRNPLIINQNLASATTIPLSSLGLTIGSIVKCSALVHFGPNYATTTLVFNNYSGTSAYGIKYPIKDSNDNYVHKNFSDTNKSGYCYLAEGENMAYGYGFIDFTIYIRSSTALEIAGTCVASNTGLNATFGATIATSAIPTTVKIEHNFKQSDSTPIKLFKLEKIV